MPDPSLFRYAVYTTLAATRFNQALDAGSLTFHEGKRWTSAAHIIHEARAQNEGVALLVSDGAYDCSNLVGWGLLDEIQLSDDGTLVRAGELKPLQGHRTQDLLLRDSGQPIAPDFIRPYALIHRPDFLPGNSPPLLRPADPRDPPTVFSFGYEGCGSGTARLVAAARLHTQDLRDDCALTRVLGETAPGARQRCNERAEDDRSREETLGVPQREH